MHRSRQKPHQKASPQQLRHSTLAQTPIFPKQRTPWGKLSNSVCPRICQSSLCRPAWARNAAVPLARGNHPKLCSVPQRNILEDAPAPVSDSGCSSPHRGPASVLTSSQRQMHTSRQNEWRQQRDNYMLISLTVLRQIAWFVQ